jgi:D-cysteine desulfhydrase
MNAKVHLAHLPTPVLRYAMLDELVGTELWVKRDDMTGGAESGNKLRKLEYLLAAALAEGADTVVTCGAAQSNHARATALAASRLGLASVLYLRTQNGADEPNTGNLRLSRISGARIEFISTAEYAERDELMRQDAARLAEAGHRAYVIPEGGSNGLGALGYVDVASELRQQQRLGLCPTTFETVICACGSGGTAAGLALGVRHHQVATRVDAIAVCDDTPYFEQATRRIIDESRALRPELPTDPQLTVHDAYKGPSYGIMSDEQREFLELIARTSGLVLDPSYTGKALYGLSRFDTKPARALFVHTGGLPGLLA